MIRIEIQYYVTETGKCPMTHWLDRLENKAAGLILARINRLSLGNMGDCKALGDGVFELRLFYGPGYRLYFGFESHKLVILLNGGDKSSQSRDIKKAKEFWSEFLRRSHE